MKKTVSLLFLILMSALILAGCGNEKNDSFLDYQKRLYVAGVTVECGGEKYSAYVTRRGDGDYLISYAEPSELVGVNVEKKDGIVSYSAGNVHVPIKDEYGGGAGILRLFELKESDMVSASPEMMSGVKVNRVSFKCDYGKADLYISTDTLYPVLINANINDKEYKLTFFDFTCSDES